MISRPLLHLELSATPGARFADVRTIALQAEAAGWTALTLLTGIGAFEPLTALAALAPQTNSLGLVAEIDPQQMHPYTAARRLAALDHASGGRAGWQLPEGTPAARAADYVDTVLALWDSWDDDVHLRDKQSGRYIDTGRIWPANHVGPFYRSAGPLDIPRPPQGHPPRFARNDARADVSVEHTHRDSGGYVLTMPIDMTQAQRLFAQSTANIALTATTASATAPANTGALSHLTPTLRERFGLPRPAPRRASGPSANANGTAR